MRARRLVYAVWGSALYITLWGGLLVLAEADRASQTHPPLFEGDQPVGDIGLWHVLDILETRAGAGTTLVKQDDGSILAEGQTSDHDTYTVVVHTTLRSIKAFKLEAMADETLPRGGPGRSNNGNFTLSGVTLQQVDGAEPEATSQVSLTCVEADYSQREYEAPGAFDDHEKTGWSIGNGGADHWLVFKPDRPVGSGRPTVLTFTFEHQHPERKRYTLGRFRLSATTSDPPPAATDVPAFQPPLVQVGYAPAPISDFQSSNASTMQPHPDNDGSVLITGASPLNDIYTLRIETELENITGLRIEALSDPSLPRGGPGRMGNGRVVLGQITLTAAPKNDPTQSRPIELREALTDDNPHDSSIRNIIDGNLKTLWAPAAKNAGPVTLAVLPERPIADDGGTVLTLIVHQRMPIGRLRVGLSTSRQRQYLAPHARAATTPSASQGHEREGVEYCFNIAGVAYIDPRGHAWLPIPSWRGGRAGYVGGAPVRNFLIKDPILNSGQSSIDSVRVPLPKGRYRVVLIFAEPRLDTQPGYRNFYVGVEGNAVLREFDPVKHTGGVGRPYVHVLPKVEVNDGTLDVEFVGTKPILNGLWVRSVGEK